MVFSKLKAQVAPESRRFAALAVALPHKLLHLTILCQNKGRETIQLRIGQAKGQFL
jgi:hypothetical protein